MHRRISLGLVLATLSLTAIACGGEDQVETNTPIGGSTGGGGSAAGGSGGTSTGGSAGSAAGAGGSAAGAGGSAAGAGGSAAGAGGSSGGAGGSSGGAGGAGSAGSPGSGIGDACVDLVGWIPIDEAVVTIDSSNAGAVDDLSASCTGKGTVERVFRFRPQSPGQIKFTVPIDVAPGLYTLSACSGTEATCTSSGTLVAPAKVGSDITLVVETATTKPYTLTATPIPSSPKDMCAPTGFVNDLPMGQIVLFEGDTTGGSASVAPTCSSAPSGTERAYRVRPLKSGTMTVELSSPEGDLSLDGAVYVRDKCDATGAEVACSASGGAGATKTASFTATAGVTYFVIADTLGTADGPFALRVSLTP